jgi:formylglycine-generating enzyme required for sulfatase activity/predicted Ser/Thr protein kinase
MNEREIFMAALDRESPDERSRYLDEACGDDRELRRRVDALLQSYADSGSFLERPVLADENTLGFIPATDPDGPQPPADDPPNAPDAGSDPISLDFLQPSDAPGSLGRLGQYEVREVVGRGGMGVVLKANDTKLNRIVAVKVLGPELASNAAARKRFVREAQAAAAVSHQHVVTIYAVEEDQLPYLAMEFIDGQSLHEKIDRQGQLQLREILRIGQQMAAGLAAAHAQGIIHRDIKPANILLENGIERVRITDFGLARAVDDVEITRPGEVAGTPQFMSPEQALGQRVDPRSDLFSLGSVLYTMCTGRPPFRADTTVAVLRRICDDTARPIREVNPDVPEWLVEIVERLLAKQPDDRLQTAAEVAELLGRHLAHVQDAGSTPFPGRLAAAERRPGGRARRRRFWLAAALILVTLVGSLGLTEATGVTRLTASVIRVVTGEGTLVIEVDDPQVSITIDGDDLVITGAGPQEVRLKPGQYQVRAAKDGQVVKQELVTIQRGGQQVIRVALEPPVPAPAVGFLPLRTGPAPPPAIAPFDPATARNHQQAWAEHLGVPVEVANSIGMKLVLIPAGEFEMGASQEEIDRFVHEAEEEGMHLNLIAALRGAGPQHRVKLTRPYQISAHEVTVGEFKQFVDATGFQTQAEKDGRGGAVWDTEARGWRQVGHLTWRNPGFSQDPNHPVVMVTWHEANAFCSWLSAKEGKTYRLPTDAQWEYACRAGTTTTWYAGNDEKDLPRIANIADESLKKQFPGAAAAAWDDGFAFTGPVGHFEPNAFGLYDMLGNVFEWCRDWYDPNYYATSAQEDPTGPTSGSKRVLRGGGWCLTAFNSRCGGHDAHEHPLRQSQYEGFRVVCEGKLRSATVKE